MAERVGIVVVAGGSGSRMGAVLPKQFLEIAGRPILVRTIERMHEALPEAEIVVVLPEAHVELWRECYAKADCRVEHRVALGGATRFDSVASGIAALNRAGKQFDLAIYPDDNHSMVPAGRIHVRERMVRYTLENL